MWPGYYRLFAAEGGEGGEDSACENSMPRAATASARACFSSTTSTPCAAASPAGAGGVVLGLASELFEEVVVEEESDTPGVAGATAGVTGAGATGELGALVRRCWCSCWCLDASALSSSEVGVRLGRRLLLLPLLPLPEDDLAVTAAPALAKVGGQGLELDGLLPLCPMNMRIWVYLG